MSQTVRSIQSICFISKTAHHLLLDDSGTRTGGAELQQTILATALASKGIKVYFITERVDDKEKICLNGKITVFPVLNFKKGNKYLRKIVYLPSQLWKTLKEVNADIYYYRNPNYLAGVTALFCRINAKQFVLAGANDWNFEKGNERNLPNLIDKLFSRLGIRMADEVLVQNNRQKRLLEKYYRRKGVVFYNVFPCRKLRNISRHVLWVSRVENYKRPKLFLELAQRLPGCSFVMVGGKSEDPVLEKQVEQEAAILENVTYLGQQSFDRVEDLFDKSYVFVNTSIPGCEGFPNTFLQAWSRGIPVISFFDIDNLIIENDLGMVVSSMTEMEKAVRILLDYKYNHQQNAETIQAFFERQFSLDSRVAEFAEILNRTNTYKKIV